MHFLSIPRYFFISLQGQIESRSGGELHFFFHTQTSILLNSFGLKLMFLDMPSAPGCSGKEDF